MKKIIIIGGYGNGTVAASTIVDINKTKKQWEILGFLNDFEEESINKFPVLGKVDFTTVKSRPEVQTHLAGMIESPRIIQFLMKNLFWKE